MKYRECLAIKSGSIIVQIRSDALDNYVQHYKAELWHCDTTTLLARQVCAYACICPSKCYKFSSFVFFFIIHDLTSLLNS